MFKSFSIFILLCIMLILSKIAYDKYCESKLEGCSQTVYEDNYLSDDHMDK